MKDARLTCDSEQREPKPFLGLVLRYLQMLFPYKMTFQMYSFNLMI